VIHFGADRPRKMQGQRIALLKLCGGESYRIDDATATT